MKRKMKIPICFGSQDAIKIPCSPKEIGGLGTKCKFQKECYKKTFEEFTKVKIENERGEPSKCTVCKHNLVYSKEDKIFYCPNCGQRYD
jgi:hypothetical protein